MHEQTTQQLFFDHGAEVISHDVQDSVKKLQEELTSFGLTHHLSKIYIYLGKYGPKTASEVVKALNLPRTEAYNQLKALMNRGLINATLRHPMKFTALPLEKAIWSLVSAEKQRVNHLELNSKNVVRLWSTIPDLGAKVDASEQRFQILEGTKQVYSKIVEIIANSDEARLLCTQNELMKLYHYDAFDKVIQSGTTLRVITKQTSKFTSIIEKSCSIQIKEMPDEISEHLCFVTTKNSLVFLIKNPAENPLRCIALWSDSRPLIYSMTILFDYTWFKSIWKS
jgi:HTH-type transcriptional regulator, sugar sensing transcriptional regulator